MIRYAISDPSILRFESLEEDLRRFFQKGATMILYRDKSNPFYEKNAGRFLEAIRRVAPSVKALLHGDPKLAAGLGANGVHLPSSRIEEVSEARSLGLYTIASAHNLQEALRAQELGADGVTLSPLFPSPGKGKALGVERFAQMVESLEIPVIALGGITDEQRIDRAMNVGAAGFASIRYFA